MIPAIMVYANKVRFAGRAGEVLVRIHAAGVNPYDTYMRAGTYALKPKLPYTPGSDGAGVVAEVGAGVKKVKRDDRVYTARTLRGAYAEYALALEEQVHPLPAKLDSKQRSRHRDFQQMHCGFPRKPGRR
jgi:NADPH2:quinone reductase